MSRQCIKPEKYKANTCYVELDMDAQLFDGMLGHFDSSDLVSVEDFEATACLCEDKFCNGGSIQEMKDELGVSASRGLAVRAGLWLTMGPVLLLMRCLP